MERYKDNIDEFFRMSLESFDDIPSDSVWDKIDNRLVADVTLWSTITSFFAKYMWYFVLGSTLFAYHLYTRYNYNELTTKVSLMDSKYDLLESEYLSLETKYSELQAKHSETENYILELEKNFSDQNSQLLSFKQSVDKLKSESYLISAYNKANFHSDLIQSRTTENVNSNSDYLEQLSLSTLLNQSNSNERPYRNTDLSAYSKKSGSLDQNGGIDALGRSIEGSKEMDQMPEDRMFRLASIREGWNWSKSAATYTKSYQRYLRNRMGFPIYNENELEIRAFKYRYGVNFSTLNVITNSADKKNFGTSIGFIHELGLTEKWSLTNSIKYNLSSYEIDNGMDQLGKEDLSNVPGSSYYQDPVKEVEVSSQYLDFNIGINRRFHFGSEGASIFINPSVGWQFYFPQEYLYTFVDGNKSVFDERRFIGYFGTAKLLLGYEKPLNENLRFQFGVYGEKSLIEQGKELKHRVNVGISSSLLFGK